MKNCPACNIEFDVNKISECLGCKNCKLRVYYNKDYPEGFSLCLEDEQDFYIKFHHENEVAIYYFKEKLKLNRDYISLEFDYPIISYKDAYKILINYKNNMVFL